MREARSLLLVPRLCLGSAASLSDFVPALGATQTICVLGRDILHSASAAECRNGGGLLLVEDRPVLD